ncbi:hypothetical protein Acr_28g0003380 [Actinidia rufa]|uniref:Uncharacterized protein n=1 Tax=Actinidia rufa TaxID=165716 RepID=A0A7J0H946_9ERIC|nr:hypothetical protein Acr_28g0003380 [Actinidia rufa]
MADEVNQLPSSPRENPPSPEASHVATPVPIERETNIMTQDGLDLLRESYSFPLSVQIRLPEEDKFIASTRLSEVGKKPSRGISQQHQGMEEENSFSSREITGVSLGNVQGCHSSKGSEVMGHPR